MRKLKIIAIGIAGLALLLLAEWIMKPSQEESAEQKAIMQAIADSAKAVQRKHAAIDSAKRMQKQFDEIHDALQGRTYTEGAFEYYGSELDLETGIYLFEKHGNFVRIANIGPDSTKAAGKILAKKLAAIQVKNLPKMRKEYAKIIGKRLWENDIEVDLEGSDNSTIRFTGGYFALNKNKKEFMEGSHKKLLMYRFKKVQFTFSEYSDDVTQYTIFEGKDSDLY